MSNNGVILLAIPYELLPVVAGALRYEMYHPDRSAAEKAWLDEQVGKLRTEYKVWQQSQEALANLLKSQGKS